MEAQAARRPSRPSDFVSCGHLSCCVDGESQLHRSAHHAVNIVVAQMMACQNGVIESIVPN
eukprot:scaffold300417_cov20-Prasinocladus_malaysianus.AAC.2